MSTKTEDLVKKLEELRTHVRPEAQLQFEEVMDIAKSLFPYKQPIHARFNRNSFIRASLIGGAVPKVVTLQKPWMETPEGYYNVKDVAKRFGVSDKAVYKWIETGKIKATTLAGYRGKLIPIDQFASDQKESRRERVKSWREKVSQGNRVTFDEDERPEGTS